MNSFRGMHSCDQSKGKPMRFFNDGMRNVCCDYCHEVVDVSSVLKK